MQIFKQNISSYRLAFIIMLSSVIGLAYNLLSENGISLQYSEISLESLTSPNNSQPHFENIKAIGLIEAYTLFEEGATFVDARDMWEYGEGHIQGAVNLPYIEFEPDHQMLGELDKDNKLVIYCGDTECGLSTKLAVELSKLGYKNLFVFAQGWENWLETGYPVSQGNFE